MAIARSRRIDVGTAIRIPFVAIAGLIPGCHVRHEPEPMPASAIADSGPGASLASSLRSVPPRPAVGCPALRADAWRDPGTVHDPIVRGNETWTAEGSPHRLPDGIRITYGGSVTLVPCAIVLASRGRAFVVADGGALFAMGESRRPVVFDAEGDAPAPGAWDGVSFTADARTTSRLVHTSIRHAGAHGAALESEMRELDLAHLVVEDAQHIGVSLGREGAFANSAVDLVVRGTREGAPLVLQLADALGSVPTGRYTNNARDVIELVPGDRAAEVRTSQTWSDRGVPYAIAANTVLRVDGSLTIAPHVTVRFGERDELRVAEVATGSLRIEAPDDPVRFVSSGSPWRGIVLGPRTDATRTRLHGLVLDGAVGLTTRDPLCARSGIERALIEIDYVPDAELFVNVRVEHLARGAAIVARQWTGESRNLFDAATRLSFTNDADFCVQTAIRATNGACPLRPQCEGSVTN